MNKQYGSLTPVARVADAAFATPHDDATDDARAHERVDNEKKTSSRQRKAFADAIRVVHDRDAWFFEFLILNPWNERIGMPPKKTTSTTKKKAPAAKKTTATKKKATPAKKKPAAKKKKTKKKKTAAKKKTDAAPKKEYDLIGQKRDSPDETDPLRKFYESLRKQNPSSVMAEVWLMEHGLLESPEAQRDAYKRFLKSKGKAVPKLVIKKVKTEPKAEVKKEPPATAKVVADDDDSDDDVPLARKIDVAKA